MKKIVENFTFLWSNLKWFRKIENGEKINGIGKQEERIIKQKQPKLCFDKNRIHFKINFILQRL